MRIGIDARELCGRPTGVGRYLAGLLDQWARCDTGHQFVLYAHENPVLPPSCGIEISDARNLRTPASPMLPPGASAPRFATHVVPGTGGTWWEQVALPAAIRRDRPDLFFAPGYTAPLRLPVPLVVAIHDVSFAAHPEWFSAREGLRRRFLSRRAAAAAAAVITISEFSRSELVEQLGVDPARIHVIPPGIDGPLADKSGGSGRSADTPEAAALFGSRRTTPSAVADWATQTPGDHVLYVGSIFNRRRIPDLVHAFSIVARAHPAATLDLVGDNRTYPRQDIDAIIRREGLSSLVRWRQYVTEDTLVSLYRRARAFAFLSEYEGLGLTPLEALAAGIPAVLLDTPVARESCGAAALYAQRGDLTGTARAIEQILFDEGTRTRLLAAVPGVLARYSWREAGQQTLALLERAALPAAR